MPSSSNLLRAWSLRSGLLEILALLSFTALTALSAHAKFYLPFTPVPITLQSLVVVLSGAVLGARRGAVSQVFVMIAGYLGLPVFTSTAVGAHLFLGPTAGYIFGFVLAAYMTGRLLERQGHSFWIQSLLLFLASLFIFVPGVVWLKVFSSLTWKAALSQGLWPFMIGDILKTLAASGFLKGRDFIRTRA